MKDKDFTNKLILGDNLEILKKMEDKTVDLIYLDPPFFSNRNYEVIWGDDGEIRSFQDRWAGGIEHYIDWLKERVREMHRILKDTGSIFLHCDWHANANIRVDILDRIFSPQNFVNEIVWAYKTGGASKRMFARKHDTIYFYSKNKNYIFNPQMEKSYMMYKYGFKKSDFKIDEETGMQYSMVYSRDVLEIPSVGSATAERIGYPTQKPEALLQRIIECATNEGDVVLDPFVGGGTTIAVADKLNRKWIGIDQSVAAVKVTDLRLKKQRGSLDLYEPYELHLRTYDYDILRNMDAFVFETMIIKQFGGIANTKQRSDLGLDGRMPDNTPIQVKRSDNINRNVIDNFLSAVKRADKRLYNKNIENKKPIGYIIAFSFSKGAIEEAARLKNKDQIIIELVKVSDIVDCGNGPIVKLEVEPLSNNEYLFVANAESKTDIEFYSWDFDHKEKEGFMPEILLDKEGKQKKKFPPGERQIAVEAVDKSGLDGMDKVKIKIKEE